MFRRLYCLFILFLFLPTLVLAHGFENEVSKQVNGYIFEFGTEKIATKAGDETSISFALHNSTMDPLQSDFWLRISKGDKIFFTTGDLKFKKSGPVFISYIFPEPGNYTLDISTNLDGREVKTFFSVDVQDPPEKYILPIVLLFVIVFMIIIKKNLKRKK